MEVEYRRYLKENKAKFMAKLMELGWRRGPSRRKRDESEEILLTYLARRWKRWGEDRLPREQEMQDQG